MSECFEQHRHAHDTYGGLLVIEGVSVDISLKGGNDLDSDHGAAVLARCLSPAFVLLATTLLNKILHNRINQIRN